jgi:hypothetical protein
MCEGAKVLIMPPSIYEDLVEIFIIQGRHRPWYRDWIRRLPPAFDEQNDKHDQLIEAANAEMARKAESVFSHRFLSLEMNATYGYNVPPEAVDYMDILGGGHALRGHPFIVFTKFSGASRAQLIKVMRELMQNMADSDNKIKVFNAVRAIECAPRDAIVVAWHYQDA